MADDILIFAVLERRLLQWRETEASFCFYNTIIYKTEFVSVCLCVGFFIPYARPQFWAHRHQIWHVASLYFLDGHGELASAACARGLALRALSARRCKSMPIVHYLTSGAQN